MPAASLCMSLLPAGAYPILKEDGTKFPCFTLHVAPSAAQVVQKLTGADGLGKLHTALAHHLAQASEEAQTVPCSAVEWECSQEEAPLAGDAQDALKGIIQGCFVRSSCVLQLQWTLNTWCSKVITIGCRSPFASVPTATKMHWCVYRCSRHDETRHRTKVIGQFCGKAHHKALIRHGRASTNQILTAMYASSAGAHLSSSRLDPEALAGAADLKALLAQADQRSCLLVVLWLSSKNSSPTEPKDLGPHAQQAIAAPDQTADQEAAAVRVQVECAGMRKALRELQQTTQPRLLACTADMEQPHVK